MVLESGAIIQFYGNINKFKGQILIVNMRDGLQRVKVGAIVLEWKSYGDINRSFDVRRNLDSSVTTIVRRLKSYENEKSDLKNVKFYDGVLSLSN
jgi:hypothetical protein